MKCWPQFWKAVLKEAVDFDLAGGVPSFRPGSQDLEEVKRLYDEQASNGSPLSNEASVVRRTPGRSSLFYTVVCQRFVWAIQRAKM